MKWIASALLKYRLLILAASAAGGVSLASSGQVSISPMPLRSLEHVGWTAADFDGDGQPDLAITETTGRNSYILDVRLSTNVERGSRSQRPDLPILFSSPSGLHLIARDVDGDHDLDIVVTLGIARQPMAVWINEGQGRFVEGDLTSFPTWDWREGFSSFPQIPPDSAQKLCSESRRCWLALASDSGTVQRMYCAAILQLRQRKLLISSCPASKRSARAPPCQLSALS
jgi:hypothetical protein